MMAIEPNNALPAPQPSEPSPTTDASLAIPASEQASTESEGRPSSWWQRLVRHGTREAEPSPEESSQEPAPANGTSARTMSQQEIDRLVQSETDRREAHRQQQLQSAERRRLRDTDPYAYAQQERETEQQMAARAQSEQGLNGLMRDVGTHHDRWTLDPLVLSLDEAERARVMAIPGAGVGLEGRKLVVEESLKALEKKWKAEGAAAAEQKLRRNPTFRKQIYAEHRGREPEPDLLPAREGRGADEDGNMSNIVRRFYGIGRE